MRAAISTLIVIALTSFALPATQAAALQLRFESEVVHPSWSDEYPFRIGERISGIFELEVGGNLTDSALFLTSLHLYANGSLLPENEWSRGFIWIGDNKNVLASSASAAVDEVIVFLGPASVTRSSGGTIDFEMENPGRQPDVIEISRPSGYGVHIRLTGPTSWFSSTDSVSDFVGGLSNFESADSWIEYNFRGSFSTSTYSDIHITGLYVVPEPNALLLTGIAFFAFPIQGRSGARRQR